MPHSLFDRSLATEIRFRDVNSFVNRLDGKCRQTQLFSIYERYKELLTGEFEDNQELRCISQEIDFITPEEEEQGLIDDRVQSQVSIFCKPINEKLAAKSTCPFDSSLSHKMKRSRPSSSRASFKTPRSRKKAVPRKRGSTD